MNRILSVVLAIAITASPMFQGGQATVIRHGPVLPGVCAANQDFFLLDGVGPEWCASANSWSLVGLPSGMVGLVSSGVCPAGFTEVAAFDGDTLIATLAAHGDIGTTGGADTITPTGTNGIPVFTGISTGTSSDSAGTPAGVVAATFSGTAATLTGSVAAPTFSGTPGTTGNDSGSGTQVDNDTPAVFVAAHTHTHSFTPAGTNSAPALTMNAYTPTGSIPGPTFTGTPMAAHSHTFISQGTNTAPSFTGNPFDNRSKFVRVIYCSKI